MLRTEDFGWRRIWDCRLPIVDCRFAKCPPLGRLTNIRTEVRKDCCPKKMAKMKEPPGMCMKTKEWRQNV